MSEIYWTLTGLQRWGWGAIYKKKRSVKMQSWQKKTCQDEELFQTILCLLLHEQGGFERISSQGVYDHRKKTGTQKETWASAETKRNINSYWEYVHTHTHTHLFYITSYMALHSRGLMTLMPPMQLARNCNRSFLKDKVLSEPLGQLCVCLSGGQNSPVGSVLDLLSCVMQRHRFDSPLSLR